MVAHDILPFCKRAMADSSVIIGSDHDLDTSRKIFTLRWENMCKVVEMEISLMYDILYTKASVAHTSFGYGHRVASPLAISRNCAVWLLLQQRRADHSGCPYHLHLAGSYFPPGYEMAVEGTWVELDTCFPAVQQDMAVEENTFVLQEMVPAP